MIITKKIAIIVASVLLLLQFCLQIHLARVDSQTTDEAIHILAGYKYLTEGDFRYNPEHPPLVKYMAGIPLLFLNLNLPARYDSYLQKANNFLFLGDPEQSVVAEEFMYGISNDPDRIIFLARIPMAFLTMLLGFAVFFASSSIWGYKSGIFSVFLFTVDPTINGHGHLVTTDIGFALGTVLTFFALWNFLKIPKTKSAILFGVSLGIALLTKFSAVLLLPISFALISLYFLNYKSWPTWAFLRKFLIGLIVAWVIVIVGYLLPVTSVPKGVLPFDALRYILIPGDYFRGFFSFINHATSGHGSYLLGNFSNTGWWYYFPVLFSAKLFIPVILLFIFSIYLILKNRRSMPVALFMLIGTVLYYGLSMTSKVNIGIRHVMPAFAMLYILLGSTLYYSNTRFKKFALTCVIIFVALEFVLIYPFYLSYFNQIYGGNYRGYVTAADSNLDWGQDLYRIQKYISDTNETVYMDYYWNGTLSLQHYKIPYNHLGDFNSEKDKGIIIIGATSLVQEKYDWLRSYPVYDRISPGVFVYKI